MDDRAPFDPLPDQDDRQDPSAKAAGDGWTHTPAVDAPPDHIVEANTLKRPPDTVWHYQDAAGQYVLTVCRWDRPDGGKDFRQLSPWTDAADVFRWRWKTHPEPRPLYGLPDLLMHPNAPVLLTEGEKTCDAARRLVPGHVCLTWPGGSNAVGKVDLAPLRGRHVIILPDADDAGAKAGRTLAARLIGIAADVRVVDLAVVADVLGTPLPTGWDLADAPTSWTPVTVAGILAQAVAVPAAESVSPLATVPAHLATKAESYLCRPLIECDQSHAAIVIGVVERLTQRGVMVDALGSMRWTATGERASLDLVGLSTELAFDLRRDGQRVDTGRVAETALVIMRRDAAQRRQEIYGRMLGRPASGVGLAEVRRWVRAVTGDEREADVQAVLHWLWLVKNRAAGRAGKMHLMLCLVGSLQGSGKSTAAIKLCAPWHELFDGDISLETITDERCAPHLAQCVVGLWDELGGLMRADMEKLKHRITASEVSYRPMRTTERVVMPSLMTLIGTSNRSLAELVKDGSGMRRFYELDVPGRCDWETINTIDMDLLWSAVSEDDVAPGITHRDLLAKEQAKLTWQHPVARWLDEESWGAFTDQAGNHHPSADPVSGVLTVDLFHRFRRWCHDHGEREARSEEMGRQLKAMGWESYRGPRSMGQKPGYRQPGIETAHPAQAAHPCTPAMPSPDPVQSAQGVQGERALSADEVVL